MTLETATREKLIAFLRPLYQDLDGVSRFDEIERIAAIVTHIHPTRHSRSLELLVLFHGLGRWMEKMGNISRAALIVGLPEDDLRRTAASIRRLDAPVSHEEQIVAAAVMIDRAGVRGLAERFTRARREGLTFEELARQELQNGDPPSWMSAAAREMLQTRRAHQRQFCQLLLDEL